MTLVKKYAPFSQLHHEINRLFDGLPSDDHSNVATSDWTPHVDIKEEKNSFVLIADIPGVAPKDIDISMDNNVLTIKGERKHESAESSDNFNRIERQHGVFYRRFALPDGVDGEKISAQSKHGVLQITIPKQDVQVSRKISVEE